MSIADHSRRIKRKQN